MRIDSYLKNLPWSRAIFPELVGELALASAMALLGTLLSDFSDGKCSSSFSVCFVTLASPFKESNHCTWRHRPRFWETGAFRKWKKILRIVSFISQRVSRKDTSDKVRHYLDNKTNSFSRVSPLLPSSAWERGWWGELACSIQADLTCKIFHWKDVLGWLSRVLTKKYILTALK